jgi:hypothetical protein
MTLCVGYALNTILGFIVKKLAQSRRARCISTQALKFK